MEGALFPPALNGSPIQGPWIHWNDFNTMNLAQKKQSQINGHEQERDGKCPVLGEIQGRGDSGEGERDREKKKEREGEREKEKERQKEKRNFRWKGPTTTEFQGKAADPSVPAQPGALPSTRMLGVLSREFQEKDGIVPVRNMCWEISRISIPTRSHLGSFHKFITKPGVNSPPWFSPGSSY